MNKAWQIAVVGAGPVGLALALHAARLLPQARITLFDARPADRDVGDDPRTLALSLGSLQFLRRLGAWPATAAEPSLPIHMISTVWPTIYRALWTTIGQDRAIRLPLTLPVTQSRESLCGLLPACLVILDS